MGKKIVVSGADFSETRIVKFIRLEDCKKTNFVRFSNTTHHTFNNRNMIYGTIFDVPMLGKTVYGIEVYNQFDRTFDTQAVLAYAGVEDKGESSKILKKLADIKIQKGIDKVNVAFDEPVDVKENQYVLLYPAFDYGVGVTEATKMIQIDKSKFGHVDDGWATGYNLYYL